MARRSPDAAPGARTLATLTLAIIAAVTATSAAAAPIPGAVLTDGDYGTVGLGSDIENRYLTVTNTGTVPAILGPADAFSVTGPDAKRFSIFDATDCGTEDQALAPGASCKVWVSVSTNKRGTSRATLTTPTGEISGALQVTTVAPTIRTLKVPKVTRGTRPVPVFRITCPKPIAYCSFHGDALVKVPGVGLIALETGPTDKRGMSGARIAGGRSATVTLQVKRGRKWLCYRKSGRVSMTASASLLSGLDRSGEQRARATLDVRPAGCTTAERNDRPKTTSGAG